MPIDWKQNDFLPEGNFKLSDVTIIQERTMCLGRCPAYKLHISGTGEVIYKGKVFVKTEGTVKYQVPQKSIYKLLLQAIDIEFFNMKDHYRIRHEYSLKKGIINDNAAMVTCRPSTVTEIIIENKFKKVVNYVGAPKRLTKFQQQIDKAVNSKQFIK